MIVILFTKLMREPFNIMLPNTCSSNANSLIHRQFIYEAALCCDWFIHTVVLKLFWVNKYEWVRESTAQIRSCRLHRGSTLYYGGTVFTFISDLSNEGFYSDMFFQRRWLVTMSHTSTWRLVSHPPNGSINWFCQKKEITENGLVKW